MDFASVTALLSYWEMSGIDCLTRDPFAPQAIAPDWLVDHEEAVLPGPQKTAPAPPRSLATIAPEPVSFQETAPVLRTGSVSEEMAAMAIQVSECTKCVLSQTRTQTVFGIGSLTAPIVFVGEGPGAEEDLKGEPFVGPAGKMLDKMILAIGLTRAQIYIANVVKCRPPGNRNPHSAEVMACHGYLFRQLTLIQPKAIFALGKFAIQTLLGQEEVAVNRVRSRVHRWQDIPVIASYHPSYLLRQPERKRESWDDLLLLIKTLEQSSS